MRFYDDHELKDWPAWIIYHMGVGLVIVAGLICLPLVVPFILIGLAGHGVRLLWIKFKPETIE